MGSATTGASSCRRRVRTAAEDFRQAGYRTAAFVSGFPLDRRFGFDRGFDMYDDHLPRGQRPAPARLRRALRRRHDRRRAALARPRRSAAAHRRPWFLWVHYYDPHAPYEPPADLAERFAARRTTARSRSSIASSARVLKATRAERRSRPHDRARDRGPRREPRRARRGHARRLRLRRHASRAVDHGGPRRGGRPRVRRPSRDRSTCCRRCSTTPACPPPAGLEGRSLRPAADGREMADAPSYAESLYPQLELGWAPLYAWRDGDYKLIDAPRPELYDLEHDATEKTNLVARAAARVAGQMRRGLAGGAPAGRARRRGGDVDPETAERLRSLGYVGGGSRGRAPARARCAIPRTASGSCRASIGRCRRHASSPSVAIRELTAVLAGGSRPAAWRGARAPSPTRRRAGTISRSPTCARWRRWASSRPRTRSCSATTCASRASTPRPPRCWSAPRSESPKFAQPLVSLAEVRIAEQQYAEAAADARARARARARSHRGAATPGRPRVPAGGHGRRRLALRADPRARSDRRRRR